MPTAEEISEEGFGYFRGTWFIGRVPVREAEATVRDESEVIELVDALAVGPDEYELLACVIEQGDLDLLDEKLLPAAIGVGLERYIPGDDDFANFQGLEIGVAGLTHALSAVGCLTAASCRWHMNDRSWSDCPVVLFAAPAWRVDVLASLVSSAGCGLGADRGLITVYGPSIRDTHRLAEQILAERGRFRRMPERWKTRRRSARSRGGQLALFTHHRGSDPAA